MENRDRARELAEQYTTEGKPLAWFDVLYSERSNGEAAVPWADLEPNPNLLEWLEKTPLDPTGKRALVVGCGLGDDVEALSGRGFDVMGFDISPAAIEQCRERFPDSTAAYHEADLFDPPADWVGAFDFVLESYTLQVLPPATRRTAIEQIAEFVKPSGRLLVISRGRDNDEPTGELPWPLTEQRVKEFTAAGLELRSFEEYYDDETPPVRRFRAEFERP
ncbi:methyltransferase domain-containing protein [Halorhabdus sp. BNX81]|uniref:class I SAM-dependent methyltransferase n=1 Tax=Halorhabdus sp. BNX81 TaxID=2980181 RepID=UPI0023DCEC42|nr:methyltransferase domain-containing protein [Halorhabdus sp. BNX81]WEL22691.1 Class I SAM-dependent methyltransferase [Halorhabdus sp. BNX81]